MCEVNKIVNLLTFCFTMLDNLIHNFKHLICHLPIYILFVFSFLIFNVTCVSKNSTNKSKFVDYILLIGVEKSSKLNKQKIRKQKETT